MQQTSEEETPLSELSERLDTKTTYDLLPDSTKSKYESAYETFRKWRKHRKMATTNQDVLIVYFTELAKKYKPTTLTALYSMFKSTLNVHENIQIVNYTRLEAFLKRNAAGFTSKLTLTFSEEHINKFIEEAPNKRFLPAKVALIFSVMGNCQLFDLYHMMIGDVLDVDKALVVNVPQKKSKTPRAFTITNEYICNICRLYISDRPKVLKSQYHLFLQYKNGKITMQRLGINSYSRMGKEIATFLKLPQPENYNGHSMRRSNNISLNTIGKIMAYQKRAGVRTAEDKLQPEAVPKAFEFIGLSSIENTPQAAESLNNNTRNNSNQRFFPSPDFEDNNFDDMSMEHSDVAPLEAPASPIDTKADIEHLEVEITGPSIVEHHPVVPIAVKPATVASAQAIQAINDVNPVGMKQPSTSNSVQDEFYLFAMSIASQLRKMPLTSALRTQLKIQQLVTEARINSHYS